MSIAPPDGVRIQRVQAAWEKIASRFLHPRVVEKRAGAMARLNPREGLPGHITPAIFTCILPPRVFRSPCQFQERCRG